MQGSQTGVFAGVMYHDYAAGPQLQAADHEILGGYLGTGTAGSVASGRLAYTFGLEGPAVSVDSACSSSLIAIHLACQELRSGECEMALAGGVSVMATPTTFIEFSRQRGLSPDGRCKSFGADADGTGWGEGVGLVLLERLSEARRKGHRVLGLIRGSAVNQDGASNGLTAPNGPSQERVIAQALADAGLSPQDIDAVEAHGTGTPLGDPIEAQALLATYGKERSGSPLRLGSIKSNIGHTQAAAGVAGVIKTIQALRHELLPPTLHAERPSEHVDWAEGAVELLNESESWLAGDRPRRAGVSSFGVSGTNAHLILEEAPPAEPVPAEASGNGGDPRESATPLLADTTLPWLLSAKTEPALRAAAARLAAHLGANPEVETADIGNALAGRSAFEHRAALLGKDRQGLTAALSALATEGQADGLVRATASSVGPVVFMFPGQGGQWAGMALELIERSPVFAEKIAECEGALREHLEDFSIEEALRGEGDNLDRLDVVQPALFSIMVSLAELWRSFGVTPDVVVGHSQGEIAAAHIAGGLSLKDAARVVALRSRALVSIAGKGVMASVAASAEEIAPLIESYEDRLSLAAINGPSSTVVSGEPQALQELLATCEKEGRRTRTLPVDYASHSSQVETIREELIEACEPIEPRSGDVAFCSTLTGTQLDTAELDASYWYRNLRETVRFEQATRSLIGEGHRTFLELSPHPVLTVGVTESIEAELEDPSAALVTGSLRREEGDAERFLASAGELWANGTEVDWKTAFEATGAKPTSLPTYPFQRERFWFASRGGAGDVAAAGLGKAEHPLLGATVPLAEGDGALFTGRISLQSHPWLADHAVLGTVLVPGSAFVELALHAGAELGCELLEELVVESPLVLEAGSAAQIQLTVGDSDEDGRRSFAIHSRPEATEDEEHEWTRHASGFLAQAKEESPALRDRAASLSGTWPPEGSETIDTEDLYERLAEAGLEYGPAFQGLTAAYRRGEELFAELALAEEESSQAQGFGIHPALLDSAFHAVGFDLQDQDNPRLPFAFSGARLYAGGTSSLRLCLTSNDSNEVSLALADETGALVFGLDSISAREVSQAQLSAASDPHRDSLFALKWSPAPAPAPPPAESPVLLGPEGSTLGGGIERYDDVEALVGSLAEDARVPRTVLLDCTVLPSAEQDRPAQAQAIASRALAEIQRWLAEERFSASRLVLVTTEAVAAAGGDELAGLSSSPLWGLVRSAQSENPGRLALIDIDEADPATLLGALGSEEPQLAIRGGEVLAPRLSREGSKSLAPPPGVLGWRLEAGDKGTFEDLRLEEGSQATAPLEPGQVRVAVKKAGLNFRDVLIALGIYPGEASIGAEGAGTVVEVGEGIDDLRPGDPVMGLLSDGFGPLAVSDRRLLAAIPQEWSFAQAASVPIAFLTAYYGLVDLAGLKAGQRVLIHAGAGGVGMAAVQIAKHLGAEVYATASPPKWETLRSLGIPDERIASSRDLDFKQRFLEETDGEGMDVVLDSLAKEFVDASLDLLPRGGHFVEMGKTDVRDPAKVAEDHPGVEYRAFDLMEAGPQRIEEMLAALAGLFEAGALQPLPISEWDIRDAPEAFRFMSQARHSGKIVFGIPARSFEPERTALITGATGTLGSLLARHLVSARGARHLLLASRQGPHAKGATELKEELEALGAAVEIAACDVSDRAQVEALLGSIPDEHPLGAVVHAAGALDDGVIDSLDPERLKNVFGPKLDAAWHLHELTEGMELSEFVLFSSAAATLGSPGQGNYAAANAFLDSLAAYRKAKGLPATSIAWGLWEETSAITETADRERLSRAGIEAISSREGLDLFDACLSTGESFSLAAPLDRGALRTAAKAGMLPPILGELVRVPARRSSGRAGALARRLAETPEAERQALVLELVLNEIAAVLGHSSAKQIDPESTFKDLGFDSLSAVELRNRLNALSGLRLPATTVFDYPTPAAVTTYLHDELAGTANSEGLNLGTDDEALRRALASIPLDRLREAGLTDLLLKMASQYAGPSLPETGKGVDLNSIDTMDLDKLVARTLEGSVADEGVAE
jgi:acyl transferase domain-containing protein/NAD(P)-dependent dehydrogenase (short-subunit alcohol dehydrogenase family)/acyl carrier protein